MIYIDLNIVEDIKELSEFIIRANNSFDINKVLEKKGDSVTVITPSQTVSAEFQYGIVTGGHATVIKSILKTIYPDYVDDSKLFSSDRDVIIITAVDFIELIAIGKINKYQYDKILEFLKTIKSFDNLRLFLNDDQYENVDDLIKELNSLIGEKEMTKEYPIGKVLFNEITQEEEKDKLIDDYLENFQNASTRS